MKDEVIAKRDEKLYINTNYYRPFDVAYEDGDIIVAKGNGYSSIGTALLYRIIEGLYMYKVNCIFKDIDLGGLYSYTDDALVIYKVTKGRLFLSTQDGKEIVINTGEICNASSNFKMSKCHSFDDELEYIGVMYYRDEMLESIKNGSLDQSFLNEFY